MSGEVPTKVCPMCAETIKAAAKVCPFCQSRLSRWAQWQQELVVAIPAVLLSAVALAIFLWLVPAVPGSSGRSFPPYRDELVVQRVSLQNGRNRPEFWLSGFLSNRSSYPWRIRELEVRFLDSKGNLLEVQHPAVIESFVVPPARECAFRVNLGRLSEAVSHARVTARVHHATDGSLGWNVD